MFIKSISILTKEQLNKYHFWIPECNSSYWILGDVEDNDIFSYQYVSSCCNDCDEYISNIANADGVRPVLVIDGLKRKIRDKFILFNIVWTVLEVSEHDSVVISDRIIDKRVFDEFSPEWKNSSLKSFLESWLDEMQEKYENESIKPSYEELEEMLKENQEKLEKLQKKIEEGRLVDVSFIEGDDVWFIAHNEIHHGIVDNVKTDSAKDWHIAVSGLDDDGTPFIMRKDTVYATKEAVENAFSEISSF